MNKIYAITIIYIEFSTILIDSSFAAGPICTEAFKNKDSNDDIMMIEMYTKCISEGLGCNYQYAVVYHNRGMNYYHLSRYGEALTDLNKSVQLYPKEKNFYVSRAKIYRAIGKTKEADVDEKMAKKQQ